LFIGAWGMASALARLVGNLLSGVVRESVTALTDTVVSGYNTVFVIEIVLLFISLGILQGVNVSLFQKQADTDLPYLERAVIANEV
jgi:BCD family chlorophyll transporter-like MFS transporter